MRHRAGSTRLKASPAALARRQTTFRRCHAGTTPHDTHDFSKVAEIMDDRLKEQLFETRKSKRRGAPLGNDVKKAVVDPGTRPC